jgi:hypothetical protein
VDKPSLTILTQAKRQNEKKQGFVSGFNQVSGSGSVFGIDTGGQKGSRKINKFDVLECDVHLRAEGFFCNLYYVFYGGLGIGKL